MLLLRMNHHLVLTLPCTEPNILIEAGKRCTNGHHVPMSTSLRFLQRPRREFSPAVLNDVEKSVKSGRFFNGDEMGWKPTEEMCRGRRDYRNHRVFTIDPTTAKDLDDALHVTRLPDRQVEIGVHIAVVSHFIPPNSAVDEEALQRATTVN